MRGHGVALPHPALGVAPNGEQFQSSPDGQLGCRTGVLKRAGYRVTRLETGSASSYEFCGKRRGAGVGLVKAHRAEACL
jgi:hypothetical protein